MINQRHDWSSQRYHPFYHCASPSSFSQLLPWPPTSRRRPLFVSFLFLFIYEMNLKHFEYLNFHLSFSHDTVNLYSSFYQFVVFLILIILYILFLTHTNTLYSKHRNTGKTKFTAKRHAYLQLANTKTNRNCS